MLGYHLNPRQLAELRAAHRAALNVREAYRLNAVILMAEGWTAAQVGQALLLDPDSVRTYFKRYQQGGLDELLRLSFMSATIRFEETGNAETTLDLPKQIEIAYSQARQITIICDNARYYRAKAVTAYLKNSRIASKFLPAYSPNLNLIKRLLKFFMLNVLYNHNYSIVSRI